MNLLVLASACFFLAFCPQPRVIDYAVGCNEYAVVVVMDQISPAKARKLAMKRAAEITRQTGNRYFTIGSEQNVEVMKYTPSGESVPQNIYQDLIIEGNFGRGHLESPEVSTNHQTFPAIRISFFPNLHQQDEKAIDATDF